MPVRQIIHINDQRLRLKAKKVKQFTPGLKKLAQDMVDTMRAYDGVGLAAPQIGVMQRIFVAEIPVPDDDDAEPHPQSGRTYILINPVVVKSSNELIEGQEGCLSIPDWQGLVERPAWVEVKAQNVDGRKIKLKVEGYLARIFSHEIDHLNGVLFIDYISDQEKLWKISSEDPSGKSQELPESA